MQHKKVSDQIQTPRLKIHTYICSVGSFPPQKYWNSCEAMYIFAHIFFLNRKLSGFYCYYSYYLSIMQLVMLPLTIYGKMDERFVHWTMKTIKRLILAMKKVQSVSIPETTWLYCNNTSDDGHGEYSDRHSILFTINQIDWSTLEKLFLCLFSQDMLLKAKSCGNIASVKHKILNKHQNTINSSLE